MAFQAGAFQGDAFQIPRQATYSGGYGYGYAEALNNADRLRKASKERLDYFESRIESLPEPVSVAIKKASIVNDKDDRERILYEDIRADNKFMRLYLAMLESYFLALAERERENDDLAIILLLST